MVERAPLATQETSRPGGGGPRGAPGREGFKLEPPATGARRRLPELVLGVLLIAGCALAAVLLAVSGRSRSAVVALSDDIERGHVVEENDLTTVQVGTDGGVSYLNEADARDLVGQVALTELQGGVLVTPEMFGDPSELLSGEDARVGMDLEASQMPSLDLAPGDRVSVVARPQGGGGEAQIVAEATVADISESERQTGQQRGWYVSLVAPEVQANSIAVAIAGESDVHLVMLGS